MTSSESFLLNRHRGKGGVIGHDAWAGMSRAAEEAGGATGCGGLRACGSTCGHEAPRPNALADKEAARIERGAWAALRCGDASAARGRRRAADTPGEKRAPHHSEQQRSCPLFGCDSFLD